METSMPIRLSPEVIGGSTPEPAIEAFEKAIELKPDFAVAHFNLGIAGAWANRLKLAEAALEKAAALDPANAEINSIWEQYIPGRTGIPKPSPK